MITPVPAWLHPWYSRRITSPNGTARLVMLDPRQAYKSCVREAAYQLGNRGSIDRSLVKITGPPIPGIHGSETPHSFGWVLTPLSHSRAHSLVFSRLRRHSVFTRSMSLDSCPSVVTCRYDEWKRFPFPYIEGALVKPLGDLANFPGRPHTPTFAWVMFGPQWSSGKDVAG